jgi:hypothetical protein
VPPTRYGGHTSRPVSSSSECQRIVVVHRRPRLGRVERLVRVELVDEQHPPVVRLRRVAQPGRGGRHRAGAGEVLLGTEPRPAVVVVAVAERAVGDPHLVAQEPAAVGRVGDQRPPVGLDRRGAVGARVGVGLPRVALVAADVVPAGEVDVVVLAAGLEQVRVVGHEHRGDVGRRRAAVIDSSHSSIDPHGFHRKSRAPTRMSWRAGMHGSDPVTWDVNCDARSANRSRFGVRTRCRRRRRACAG